MVFDPICPKCTSAKVEALHFDALAVDHGLSNIVVLQDGRFGYDSISTTVESSDFVILQCANCGHEYNF